jgi:hypothetical protein
LEWKKHWCYEELIVFTKKTQRAQRKKDLRLSVSAVKI